MATKVEEKKIQEALDLLSEHGMTIKKTGRKTASEIKREIRVAKDLLKKHNFTVMGENEYMCTDCGRSLSIKEGNYYLSQSRMYQDKGLITVCKKCLESYFNDYMIENSGDIKLSFYMLCREVNAVFSVSAVDMAIESKNSTFKTYFQKINSLNQFDGMSFKDSDPYDATAKEIKEEKDVEAGRLKLSRQEKQARTDIVESIGRDPFEDHPLSDQKVLYPDFVEYLDEDTAENPFLVSQIIQICLNNLTIAKLNQMLAKLASDLSSAQKNDDKIKNAINNIKTLSAATTSIADKNGIAKKGGESKKRSTLTGMMTYYRDLELDEIEVDYYNQKVCLGMQRASDISTKSIFEQDLFGENEFAEMLNHSRELVKTFERKVLDLEEENRILNVKIKTLKGD